MGAANFCDGTCIREKDIEDDLKDQHRVVRSSSIVEVQDDTNGHQYAATNFSTLEHAMSNRQLVIEEHSDSEEEDDDFGGYTFKNEDIQTQTAVMNRIDTIKAAAVADANVREHRSSKKRKRKKDNITEVAFENFRIEPIDVPSTTDLFKSRSLRPDSVDIHNIDSKDKLQSDKVANIATDSEISDEIKTDDIPSDTDAKLSKLVSYDTMIELDNVDDKSATDLEAQPHQAATPISLDSPPSSVREENLSDSESLHTESESERSPIPGPDSAKGARRRVYIEREIISSEKVYIDMMGILLHDMFKRIFDDEMIPKTYYEQIHSSLPQIFEFHTHFISELRAATDAHQSLAHVFVHSIGSDHEAFVQMYIDFVKSYKDILDLFGTTFHKNDRLQEFLKEKRLEQKPLSNLLITPVQRIPRYILLLSDLKKQTEKSDPDYLSLVKSLKMMQNIADAVDKRQGEIENLSQCMQIQEALSGFKEPIAGEEDRHFIEQFVFVKESIMHQRLFFVFSDMVIIANAKWNVKHVLDIRTVDVKRAVSVPPAGMVGSPRGARFGDRMMRQKSTKRKPTVKKSKFPKFNFVSLGQSMGSVTYVAKSAEEIVKFERVIRVCRLNQTMGDIHQRKLTLRSLKLEIAKDVESELK